MNSSSLVFWNSGRVQRIVARIAITGDFLPAGSLSLRPGGWVAAARLIAPTFEGVDVSFANLEAPLDTRELPARPIAGIGQIVAADSASLAYLEQIRCSAVGIANNHMYDFGPAGAERTRAALVARNLVPLGAARTLSDPPEVFIWHGPGNVRVGFWAAARASRDLAGRHVAGVEPATIERARLAFVSIKSRGAQLAVALLHSGCIRTNRPDPSDAALMNSIARTGFDLVAASHSHRISGAKALSIDSGVPAFCFYGLGSIVSGYVASPLEREGLVIVAGLHSDGSIGSVEIRPLLLADSGFGVVPPPETASAILGRFLALSREISDGSYAHCFYKDVSPGAFPLYARDLQAAYRQSGLSGLVRKAQRIRPRHIRRLIHGMVS
jgi:hypothetical protein